MASHSDMGVNGFTEQMPDGDSRPPGKVAAAPFDRRDADFILRSSDNMEFRVHRLILSMASSVFDGMFAIPKPPMLSSDPNIPEVSLSEDNETLDLFLRVCYPLIEPEVPTLPLLRKVLTSGIKYDAPLVVHAMKKELRQARFMETDPVRVFAIACLCDLEEEAKIAAEAAVVAGVVWDCDKSSRCPELDEISAGAYYRLLQLNRTRRPSKSKPKRLARSYSVNFGGILPLCRRPLRTAPVQTSTLVTAQYPFTSLDGAEVILRSADSVNFFVHQAIITFASPTFFDTLLQERTVPDEGNPEVEHRPVYGVSENSSILDVLLQMCYPVDHPHIASADVYLDVACAARKYHLRKVEQTLLKSWSEYSREAPLRFYFAAVECEWQAEAEACALQLVTSLSPSDLDHAYVPEMETTGSVPYRRLLSYARACRQAAATSEFQFTDLPVCEVPGYPTAVSIDDPPSWLLPRILAIRNALALKPSTSVVTSTVEMGKILLSDTVTDVQASSAASASMFGVRVPETALSPESVTIRDSKVTWVIDLLRKYAAAVDKAVSEVKL